MQNISNLTRNQIIASAASTLEVLEVISQLPSPTSLAAIVKFTGKPKGTIHRMVSTLVNTGFVKQDSFGLYSLTLKAWSIGSTAVQGLDLVEKGRPVLSNLGLKTGETVHLSVLDPSGGVVYVSKVESPKSISVQTRLGQVNPSWCTATGRSIIAFNESAIKKVLEGELHKYTGQTVTSPTKIRKILEDVVNKGYSVTLAENHPDMGGIAAPIRDFTGEVVASCGVAIPEFRMSQDLVEKFIPIVVESANSISKLLGCPSKIIHKGNIYAS